MNTPVCLGVGFFDSEMMVQGGPVMYLILFASLVGMIFALYSLLMLRRKMILPRNLVEMAETLKPDDDACAEAENLCNREGGPLAEVLVAAIRTRKATREDAEAFVESAGRRAAHSLSLGPDALEVVAAIAPLLGLLGTVTGMQKAFRSITITGVKEIGNLSGPIGEALWTTIVGLLVGIPALIAYSWFSRRRETLVLELERYGIYLMAALRRK